MNIFRSGSSYIESDARSTGVQLKSASKLSTMIRLITIDYPVYGHFYLIYVTKSVSMKHERKDHQCVKNGKSVLTGYRSRIPYLSVRLRAKLWWYLECRHVTSLLAGLHNHVTKDKGCLNSGRQCPVSKG